MILPADAGNQPIVQIRVITTNVTGTDEYVGIDSVNIASAASPPTATGTAMPAEIVAGEQSTLTAVVTPGTLPLSTGLSVFCTYGGGVTLHDDGTTSGDPTANDNEFTGILAAHISDSEFLGPLRCTVSDAENRNSEFFITFAVRPTCGNRWVETGETCDDDNTTSGDGCSATCQTEDGYTCDQAGPSVCTDIDECANGSAMCSTDATCANTPGTFTCTCNDGFSGDGTTCTDLDECTLGTDNCDANAACENTSGSFTCACNAGFEGDGTACTDIDECVADPTPCDANATCTNVAGGFGCECNTGFTGDGLTCTAVMTCGDGVLDTGEDCDDGNAANGDGCNATCAVEPNFVCTGMPSVCRGDRDGDGVANVDDNCPDVSNANQTDADGNAIGDACESDGDGGCCSSSRDGGTGAWLLALGTLLGLRRRRR